MSHRHEALAGFPVVVGIPLLWGDLDAFGHINNVVYFRWCETARVEYMVRVGLWVPLEGHIALQNLPTNNRSSCTFHPGGPDRA